jgi:hypothetical protein
MNQVNVTVGNTETITANVTIPNQETITVAFNVYPYRDITNEILNTAISEDPEATRDALELATVATTGSYDDLVDVPTSFPNDDVTAATADAVAGTLVRRSPDGTVEFATVEDTAISASAGDDGIAISASATSGKAIDAGATSGLAISAVSFSGTNHAEFGSTADNRSFIRRVLGLIGWHRGIYTQTLGSPATLASDRTVTLPDASGTVALTSDIPAPQTITLTGDVTGSGTGTFAATIANDAVTFAKMQNISGTILLGRHAGGSGNPQEVSVGNGVEFHGSGIRREALTGDVTASAGSNTTTLATVNANVGAFGSATQVAVVTVNAKGLVTAASNTTITPAVGSITGLGTGVGDFLATPSSANLATAVSDETGTGALVFGSSPTIDAPTISGAAAFTSTTRPTSSGTGTPAATSLITRNDIDTRLAQKEVYLSSISSDTGAQVTNSTTLVDSGLEVILPVGTYKIEIVVNFYSITSNNGGHKIRIDSSGGTVNNRIFFFYGSEGSGVNANSTNTNIDRTNSNNAGRYHLYANGIFAVTSSTATIKIRHALNTTDGAVPARGTMAGSYIKATRLS